MSKLNPPNANPLAATKTDGLALLRLVKELKAANPRVGFHIKNTVINGEPAPSITAVISPEASIVGTGATLKGALDNLLATELPA